MLHFGIHATRLGLGALVIAAFWIGFALLCTTRLPAALFLGLSCLFLWPWLVPLFTWIKLRISGQLIRLPWTDVNSLRDLCLENTLENRPLHICLWVAKKEHNPSVFFFFDSLQWWRRGITHVVVSQSWIDELRQKQSSAHLNDFKQLLKHISQLSLVERRLRSVKICLWVGAFFWLDLAMNIMSLIMKALLITPQLSFQFWAQRGASAIKQMWMGTQSPSIIEFTYDKSATKEPQIWNSLLWGVWALYTERFLHPTWRLFLNNDNVLSS